MTLEDELKTVTVRDARYSIDAYEFAFAALEHARRSQYRASRLLVRSRARRKVPSRHVTGQELCYAARDLARGLYGRLAYLVVSGWGLKSTSDLGAVVYNLIDAGILNTSPDDRREDFDDVYDFQAELTTDVPLSFDDLDA